MDCVLASIQPYWCQKIASGIKTLEIRTTKPKLNTPFKCYVYCTKGKAGDPHDVLEIHAPDGKIRKGNGKIIGEFTCDRVIPILVFPNGSIQDWNFHHLEDSCVDYEDMADYIGGGNTGYGWHISDFVLYDVPKDIQDFNEADACPYHKSDGCSYPYHCFRAGKLKRCGESLDRAPQSWRYVSPLE